MSTRSTLTAALVLALALALAPLPARAEDTLSFAERVEVGGDRVTLLDLVEPGQNLAQALTDQLGRYSVAVAPALGRSTPVAGTKIRALLRQANLGEGLSVLIPAQVIIVRASQRLAAQQLARLYTDAIMERLGPRAKDADINRIDAGADLLLPAGRLDTNLRFLGTGLMGRVPAVIEVMVDGRREALARVVGSVDIYAEVVVATRPLMPRQIIGADDVTVSRANLSQVGPGAILDLREAVGMRTRAMVPLGAPVDMTQLDKNPLVRLGDVVLMVYAAEGVRITAKGKAEQTGYLGSRIRLMNMASKREVYGRVTEAGAVVVE